MCTETLRDYSNGSWHTVPGGVYEGTSTKLDISNKFCFIANIMNYGEKVGVWNASDGNNAKIYIFI